MMRSRHRQERRTFHVSCSDEQWAEAKRRAAAAGMKTSPFLIDRALNADLSIFDDRPQPERLMLSEQDQKGLLYDIEYIMGVLEQALDDGEAVEKLRNQVEFLRDTKVTEMIAEGRMDELFLAYAKLFGEERAERLLAKAVRERHGASSVEVIVKD